MSKPLLACLAFALTVGLIATWVILTRPIQEPMSRGQQPASEGDEPGQRDRVSSTKSYASPAERAAWEFSQLAKSEDRLALLEWASTQTWADHKTALFRKAMAADPNAEVQVKALEKSVALAQKAGPQAVIEVIRAGLSVATARVVQQSLREARKHPSPELVPDLLEVAESGASHRFLAIDALAFTDDDRARAKVIEVASRADWDRSERIRAIALLTKVKGQNALELLGRLTGDGDEQVRMVAMEALAAREAR